MNRECVIRERFMFTVTAVLGSVTLAIRVFSKYCQVL